MYNQQFYPQYQQNVNPYFAVPQNNGLYGFPTEENPITEQTVFNQLLTPEEVSRLRKTPNGLFDAKLTEDDYLRAVCTHKEPTGKREFKLLDLGGGKFRCTICQAEFHLLDTNTSKEDVDAICANFYDLMQSIKTYYGNAPMTLREFYTMLGFVPKVSQLWNIAKQYFDKATLINNGQQPNTPDQSGFNVLNNVMGPGALGIISPGMVSAFNNQYGVPSPGYYNPIPQAANIQTPQQPYYPPQQPPPYGYPQTAAPAPQYGYPMNPMQQPQQQSNLINPNIQQQPMDMRGMSGNPIGVVEQPAVSQAGQPQMTSTTQPLPDAPTNPNIKADVGKTFKG